MATVTDTTTTDAALAFGNDLGAMARRINGISSALAFLHHAYSEEQLEGVEQLVLDLQREAERLEGAYDAILKQQGAAI